jgi:hypothetical protein
VLPLAFTLVVAAIAVVVAGVCTKSMTTAAQVGTTVGGGLGQVLMYVPWRMS